MSRQQGSGTEGYSRGETVMAQQWDAETPNVGGERPFQATLDTRGDPPPPVRLHLPTSQLAVNSAVK